MPFNKLYYNHIKKINKFFICSLLLVFYNSSVRSQTETLDGVKNNPQIQINQHLQLVNECTLDCCKVYHYKLIAVFCIDNSDLTQAKRFFDSALKIIDKQLLKKIDIKRNEINKGRIYNELAIAYTNIDYVSALNYNNTARVIFEKYNDLVRLRSSISIYGNIYSRLNQPEKSFFYIKQDSAIIKKLLKTDSTNKDFRIMLAQNYNNLGVYHLVTKNYNKAIDELSNGLKIAQKYGDTNKIISIYLNLATSYRYLKNYKSAHKNVDSCLKANQNSNKNILAMSYLIKAKIYFDELIFEKSLTNINIAEKTAKQYDQLPLLSTIYEFKSLLLEKTKDYKGAVNCYKLLSSLKDTIYKSEALKNELEFKEKYESEKKEKEILKLSSDNNIKQLEVADERKAKRLFFIITIAISVILILVLILFYTVNKLRKKEAKTNIELNKQAAQIAKYQSQMNPHFIFNALSNLQNLIVKNKGNEANNLLLNFTKLMRKTLNNSDLEYINLSQEIDYLNTYFNFEKSKFDYPICFNINIDKSIEPENLLILPMLIQPFIENSFKHGGFIDIKNPIISLSLKKQASSFLSITITDNGKGLQQSHQSKDHQSKAVEITKKRIVLWYQKYNLTVPNYFAFTNNFDENNTLSGITINLLVPLIEEF